MEASERGDSFSASPMRDKRFQHFEPLRFGLAGNWIFGLFKKRRENEKQKKILLNQVHSLEQKEESEEKVFTSPNEHLKSRIKFHNRPIHSPPSESCFHI
jgi:hypothetical protein